MDRGKGSCTCFTSRGSSVVDYVVTSQNFMEEFTQFEVDELLEISDHCPILFQISLKSAADSAQKYCSQNRVFLQSEITTTKRQKLYFTKDHEEAIVGCYRSQEFGNWICSQRQVC